MVTPLVRGPFLNRYSESLVCRLNCDLRPSNKRSDNKCNMSSGIRRPTGPTERKRILDLFLSFLILRKVIVNNQRSMDPH